MNEKTGVIMALDRDGKKWAQDKIKAASSGHKAPNLAAYIKACKDAGKGKKPGN